MCIPARAIPVLAVLLVAITAAKDFAATDQQEVEYTRAITERSQRIVDQLELTDPAAPRRITDLLVGQYRGLRDIHDARDLELARASENASSDDLAGADRVDAIRQRAEISQFQLHRQFVSRLSVQLTPAQVDAVKDGMTYGTLERTLGRYLQLLPELKDEEKNTIQALLVEAREYAMDGGSSDEKHGWFRKYKGKINNYLSSQGYDIAEAERRLNQ